MSRDNPVAVPGRVPLGSGPFAGQAASKLSTGQVFGVRCGNLHHLLVTGHRPHHQSPLLFPVDE